MTASLHPPLLTSRLMPQGTREYPPIHLHKFSVKGLEIAEGIELLQKQGVNASLPELHAAVERCKGHALALTLLASLLRNNRSLTLNVLLEDHTYGYLWTGSIAENLLDRIYTQELDQQQRELLLAFSIYREAVPLEAAHALLEPLLDENAVPLLTALQGLLHQHLLQAFGERRYQPHAIVAEYTRLYFLKGDEQAYRQALDRKRELAAQYYVEQAATTRLPREQRRDISDVHLLIEAIWQYCQAEKWREAYDLLQQEQLFPDLQRWGDNAVLLDLYQMLLPLKNWPQERSEAAGIYRNIASIYNLLGQKEQALMYYEKALDIYKELGEQAGEAAALSELGSVYLAYDDQTKRQQGLKRYEAALYIYRELGERQAEGTALSNIGMAYTALGQKKEARKHYREALSIFREVKENQEKSGRVLNSLGQIYSALGQRERAQKHYEEALHIFRELGDRNGEATTLNNLGKLYDNQWLDEDADQQEKERAGQYYEEALHIFHELGDREEEGKSAIYLGLFYNGLGKKKEALEYYESALRIFREIGDRWETGTVLTNLGLLHDDMGQKEEARKHYEEALHVHREVGNHGGEGRTLFSIGILAFELHRYDAALNCFLHARQILEATQSPSRSGIQRWIDALRVEVGEEQFRIILAQAESEKQQANFTFHTISSNP
jgi:tetratricopeptide (TPR) repeat protein